MKSLASPAEAPRQSQPLQWRRFLLSLGALSSFHYLFLNVLVPFQDPSYSVVTQTISELSAIGAPTRTLWIWLGLPYTLMLFGFGWGVWHFSKGRRTLKVIGAALMVQGAINPFWPPMHTREVLAAGGGTLADTLHLVFAFVWSLLAIAILINGAFSLGRRFSIYTWATLSILAAAGIWTFLEAPGIEAGTPTPWIGIAERVNIGAFMLWMAVFSVVLLRSVDPKDRA